MWNLFKKSDSETERRQVVARGLELGEVGEVNKMVHTLSYKMNEVYNTATIVDNTALYTGVPWRYCRFSFRPLQ